MTDTEAKENNSLPKKRSWVVPTVTTLIGVVVSLLVAWYQITLNEEQALRAEIERSKAVKSELIQIVEEHIINNKPLDVSRLARLSEYRAKQEKLILVPSVSEIVEGAEFNILKSQYLEFDKKENFKAIFNEIYAELSANSKITYNGFFENSVNDLYGSIYSGNSNDAASKLNKLLGDFNTKIEELNAEKSLRETKSLEDIVKVLFDKPYIMLMAMSIYFLLLSAYMYYVRRRKRRREIEDEVLDEYRRERAEFMFKRSKGDLEREP